MIIRLKSIRAITFLFLLGVVSCSSPQKLVDQGNYDTAIQLAVKKLSGKKVAKEKYVQALEEAFNKANNRDLREAERLKREGRPENWPKINEHYQRIRSRQNKVAPLLPLADQFGVQANFRFIQVDELEFESREKSAEYHYVKAKQLLLDAQDGDKLAARQAYDELNAIDQYFRDYKEKGSLKQKAQDLGVVHTLIKVENRSGAFMPAGLDREIRLINVNDLNSFWEKYYTQSASGVDYDYEAILNIINMDVGPSLVQEREFEESREVEDGWEYVLDKNGNVSKDSLGNDIKVPKKVVVKAWVLETHQTKVATLTGRLEIYDTKNRNTVRTSTLTADAVFENYAATFRGDKRALSTNTKNRLGNRPLPFPSDEALLFQAAERVKPIFKEQIADTRKWI
ncbi:MAG TPA: hypothetical protein PKA00_23585 [Saprospiraceae bacterium]|nr:hypothetical protein [Saprospiraceae bacterium]HMQ85912.1 hypothetical protein [Saprospiraceae bacterium]